MNFRARIWMLPISVGVVFGVALVLALWLGARNADNLETLRSVDNPFLEQLLHAERAAEKMQADLQAAATEGDADKLQEAQDKVKLVRDALGQARALEGKQPEADTLLKVFEVYSAAAVSVAKAMVDKQDPMAAMQTMQQTQQTWQSQMQSAQKGARQVLEDRYTTLAAGQRQTLWINALTSVLILLGLGVASHIIISSVWRDLGGEPAHLRDLVHRVADGDLDIPTASHANLSSSLRASVDTMTGRLQGIVRSIRSTSEEIESAAHEIASGNQDLSDRTEQTASNLQRVAGELDQITGKVAHSAESAQEAKQLTSAVAQAAERGGSIMTQVVHNMDEISTASHKINDIISVIDGIAFQTNILALNAAVEAARAGEQGRGFAVVASEVRALAGRSADAAKEIKTLISASGTKVDSGLVLVNEAGAAMANIVQGVQRVVGIMGTISDAASEQSGSIQVVSKDISELDNMTQQNAALVEESAAAAASLRELTSRLVQAVAVFKTSTGAPRQALAQGRVPLLR